MKVDEKDNTVDETFSPGLQSTPQHSAAGLLALVTSEQTVFTSLGHQRSSLAPSKQSRTAGLGDVEIKTLGKTHSPGQRVVSGAFHAKTSSITGSLTGSETMSDSTISFPSSGVSRKPQDGSEADSERDSVSPQRIQDTEVRQESETSSLFVLSIIVLLKLNDRCLFLVFAGRLSSRHRAGSSVLSLGSMED